MTAAVIPIGTRPVRATWPGARVAWVDDNGDTRTGVVAHDDDTTTDLRIGPPGGPTRHLVPVLPDEPTYVDAEDLRLI